MTTRFERAQRDYLFPGVHEKCDMAIDELKAAALDHDARRRQLQARNTELVEENRVLRAELAAQRQRSDALLTDYWTEVRKRRAAEGTGCGYCPDCVNGKPCPCVDAPGNGRKP